MSEYCGYVVKVKELRQHSNADRLQIATFFGNDTCVGLNTKIGDLGIYFPCDLQLSMEFCIQNHLLKKLADGTPDTGYMEPDKRRVTAIKLRGEKSDGLYLPISALDYIKDYSSLTVGTKIDVVDGHEICCKYIPKGNNKVNAEGGNKVRKKKVPVAPLFVEHADTEQLAYNLSAFKPGDTVELTLKMHGTSQRTAYLPVLQGFKRTLWDRITRKEGTPIYDWGYVTGTRRTVLDTFEGGYYGNDKFREEHAKAFEGKLPKGVEVYYEVVGYVNEDTPIMPRGKNSKVSKEFAQQYGAETIFSYGCEPGESKAYIYRMTMTNEDGFMVEIEPAAMRIMAEKMGIECCPLLKRFVIPDEETLATLNITAGEYVQELAEKYNGGVDPIGRTHVREGVVARIINREKFTAHKSKNFEFRVISGIALAQAEESSVELSADILNEM